jgi:peptide chain release factor subunit 3
VLRIAQGDRQLAVKLLDDPDSLMMYDDVRVLLEAGATGELDEVIEQASAPAPTLDTDVPEAKQDVQSPISGGDEEEEGAAAPVQLREDDIRENINLVFIGHVDAGKSTLSGNILYLTDNVDKRTIERYEREAKARSRESWFLAFIMDTSEEERAKGKTVEVGRAHFSTPAKRYTILDAPGHKNYVPNMIAGAAQADVGVLVISARRGEFETGFERGGQTREHALLAKTLGVKYLVVVVNKMDEPTVRWSQDRYDECCSKLKPFLKQCGYTIKKDVRFIPISGLNGANVKVEVSPDVRDSRINLLSQIFTCICTHTRMC